MEALVQKVVILGGGTAGWMTAAYLQKSFGKKVHITLIESANIPKIGVGEATVPNLQRVFFDALGIPETEWMPECNAAFKGAVRFQNWTGDESGPFGTHFYHHFGLLPNCDGIPLSHYWSARFQQGATQKPFGYECFSQSTPLDHKLSPQFADGRHAFTYAWHFDAQLVAAYLCRLAKSWGVDHVVDDLVCAERSTDGSIESLKTIHCIYNGDFFIDCSGFRGLLINETLEEPFLDMSSQLLCDSAVASAIPHDDARDGIEPYTSAIAMKHGWTWKIPMLGRFGAGYVYSSSAVSDDEAADEFIKLWRHQSDRLDLKRIRFRTGRNRRAWVKNCVSIGLSSCFLEPLESTGIYFITAALFHLGRHFPGKHCDATLVAGFNSEIEAMFDECRDFVQAHYLSATRADTPFWRACKTDLKVSEELNELLRRYDGGLVVNMPVTDENAYYENFEAELRNFWTNGSYYCVLAGMGRVPQVLPRIRYREDAALKAAELFKAIAENDDHLCATLPTCYQRLCEIHGRVPSARTSG